MKSGSKIIFCLMTIFLIVGQVNHCILEEAANFFSKNLTNQSHIPHSHQETPTDSHEHGQPHQLLAVSLASIFVIFNFIPVLLVSFLLFVSSYIIFIASTTLKLITRYIQATSFYIEKVLLSSCSPQAPPLFS